MTEGNQQAVYKAMLDAGLLKSTVSLTNAKLQETIASQTNSNFKAQEVMQTMGLQIAMEGEEVQTVELTGEKLKLAVASGTLTEAQAREIAMHHGVTFAMEEQSNGAIPTWLSKIEAIKKAVGEQITTTVNWVKSLSLATKAMLGVSVAVGAAAVAYKMYSDHVKQQNEDARESAQAINEQNQSLEENVSKIRELRERLNDSNISEQEAYNLKTQLYEIQKSLIESYGDEAEGLQLVNGNLDEQIAKLRTLNEEKAVEWQRDNQDAIGRADKEMTRERNIIVGGESNLDKNVYQSQIDAIQEIVDKYEGLTMEVFEDINNGNKLSYEINFTGNVTQAKNVLDDFSKDVQSVAHDFGEGNNIILSNLVGTSTAQLKEQEKIIENNIDTYVTNLQAEIAQAGNIDIDGRSYNQNKVYGEYLDAVEAYNKALSTGEGIDEAKKKYEELLAIADKIIAKRPDFEYLFNPDNSGLNQVAVNREDFKEQLNTSGFLKTKTEIVKGLQDIDLESSNMSEDQKEAFDYLVESGEEYGLSLEDVISVLKELGIVQEEVFSKQPTATNTPFSKEQMISTINGMSEGFEALDKIMKSQKDKNPFDFSLLDDKKFKETFGSFTEEYTDFVDTITKSPKDVSACQSAYDNLVSVWLRSTGVLSGLSEENAGIAKQYLELMGITNAEALVEAELTVQRNQSKLAALASSDATYTELVALRDEVGATEEARLAINKFYLEKITANGITLSTSGDLENIMALVSACGGAVAAIRALYNARQGMFDSFKSTFDPSSIKDMTPIGQAMAREKWESDMANFQKEQEKLVNDAQKEIDDVLNGKYNVTSANYGGGNKTNAPSSGGSDKSDQSKEFDWIERKISLLREEYSKYKEEVDDSNNSFRTQLNYLSEAEAHLKEIIATEKQAENIYFANWEKASEGLSDDIKSKIMNGNMSIEEYSSNSDAIDKAMSAWDDYKAQRDARLEDEKELQSLQASEHEKQMSWRKEEVETLKERASASQRAYMEEINFMQQAVAKEEEAVSLAKAHAGEAEQAWRDAIALIQSTDIAKILGGTINLDDYEGEYRELIEAAIKASENKTDADKELADEEQELEDTRREAYEKALEYIQAQQDYISSIKSTIESEMDLINASGGLIIEAQYEDLIRQNDKLIDQYEDQKDLIEDRLDEVEYESQEYYELKGELEKCTQEINKAKEETEGWCYEIKMLPIYRIEKFLTILDAIKENLQGFIDWEGTLGISSSKDELQQMIDLDSERIVKLQEQLQKYQDVLASGEYEYGSDKYNELVENINSVGSAISDAANEQQELNQQLLNIPVNKISKLNEGIQTYQNIVSDQLDEQETAISAVIGAIDAEIKSYEELKTKAEEVAESQTKPLQDQLDLLEKTNEARKVQLDLEQAQFGVQEAENNKNIKVINSEGKEEYRSDIDALRDARNTLADAEYEKLKYDIQTEIDNIEEQKDTLIDGYDEEIDRLDKIKSRWEEICDLISQSINEQTATKILGEGWKETILSGNDDKLYEEFYKLHSSTEFQNDSITKQIESNERIISQTQIIIDRFNAQEITLEEAKAAINNIVGLMQNGYTADEQLSTQLGLDQVNSIKEFQQVTSDKITENMGLMNEYFTVANDNNLKIIEVMGTQTEKLEEIRKLDEENKRLYEEMLKKIEEMNKNYKYHSSSGGSDDGGSYSGGSGVKSSGTITTSADGRGHDNPDYSDTREYHTGIENGLVGKDDRSREEALKKLGTKELKPNEELVVVERGEAIFTEAQQDYLLNNFEKLRNFMPMVVPKTYERPYDVIAQEASRNFEFNFGDINLHEVNDPNRLGRAIVRNFEPIFRQELSKNKYH